MRHKREALNFSFVKPGEVAGMSRPGVHAPLAEDLAFLKNEGIGAIISLSVTPLDESALRENEFLSLHVPLEDFSAPTIQQVEQVIEFIERMIHVEDRAVAVHCGAGCGRTGTALACHFVKRGASAEDAVNSIREIRPGSIETDAQLNIVHLYEKHLKKQLPAI